jgi:hypothetical protein
MLDEDVYAVAREMAKHSGRSLGAIVSQLVRKGLASEPTFEVKKNGVPVFGVKAGTPSIPGNRAAELLAEEA